jgi:D-3-phosphoglycerate dehydrogenase
MPIQKPFIIFADGMDNSLFEKLKHSEKFRLTDKPKLTQDELRQLLPEAQGLVIRSATTVTSELLTLAPQLKYVIRAGEGVDNIDLKACAAKGVKVSNTPGANNNSAAEHAIALMMTLMRKTHLADASMKRGEWEKTLFTGTELWKKKIGIVGMGRIGQIVAKRLAGFEPEIIFYDPFIEQSPFPYAKKADKLEDVFLSDIVTIHVPKAAQTLNLIGEKQLQLMKKNSILINASRGGIVNEDALLSFLSTRNDIQCGLDVFQQEPLPTPNPWQKLPNVLLTPHIGASTAEAQFRVGELVIEQLLSFFEKEILLNEVKI